MCYGVFMIKNKHFNKKAWLSLKPAQLTKVAQLTNQIKLHNYLVEIGVITTPVRAGHYANNQSAIERGFSLRLVKLGHR